MSEAGGGRAAARLPDVAPGQVQPLPLLSELPPTLVALLAYLPTVWPFSQTLFIVLVLVAFARVRVRYLIDARDVLLLLFVGGTTVVFLMTLAGVSPPFPESRTTQGLRSALYLATPLIARNLPSTVSRVLVRLFAFEATVAVAQFAAGVPAFFPGQAVAALSGMVAEWGEGPLLYSSRVLGLSLNSSVAAQKFFLGFLLLERSPGRGRWLVAGLLTGGLIVTFNRTALICTALFVAIVLVRDLLRPTTAHWQRAVALALLLVLPLALVLSGEFLSAQFLRDPSGRTTVDVASAGRRDFWAAGIDFIRDHPIAGNLGHRYTVDVAVGVSSHLHSSALQLLADHGILGLLLIGYVVARIRYSTLPHVLTMLLFSSTQPSLFWSISIMDIGLYQLLGAGPRGALRPSRAHRARSGHSLPPAHQG